MLGVANRCDLIDDVPEPDQRFGRQSAAAQELLSQPVEVELRRGFHHLHGLPRQDERPAIGAKGADHDGQDAEEGHRTLLLIGIQASAAGQRRVAGLAIGQNE
jgi:hypothetical protein